MRALLIFLAATTAALALDLPEVSDVLKTTGKAVETFWEQFPAVNCTETVTQDKFDTKGKVAYTKISSFDYLVLLRQVDEDLVVQESRVAVRAGTDRDKKSPLLVSNGFSTLLLIFHPRYQHSYEYSMPVQDRMDGREVLRVDYRHSRGAPSPSSLRLRQHDYPLEWKGTAWLDPDSGAVVKVVAELNSGMEELGLSSLKAEVTYALVDFGAGSRPQWLPAVAQVEAQTPRQHWRNTHRFTGYKRFTVETKTITELPK